MGKSIANPGTPHWPPHQIQWQTLELGKLPGIWLLCSLPHLVLTLSPALLQRRAQTWKTKTTSCVAFCFTKQKYLLASFYYGSHIFLRKIKYPRNIYNRVESPPNFTPLPPKVFLPDVKRNVYMCMSRHFLLKLFFAQVKIGPEDLQNVLQLFLEVSLSVHTPVHWLWFHTATSLFFFSRS
jgi:hypothetical protein